MVDVSIIIPFRNEKGYAAVAVESVYNYLKKTKIDFEIIAIDDSTDETWDILKKLEKKLNRFRAVQGWKPPGYGKALRKGFQEARGKIVIPYSGDMCESLDDVMKYIEIVNQGYDMALGSRFIKGGKIINYPKEKLFINRLGNFFLQILFLSKYNDFTNGFKGYSKRAFEIIKPKANSYELGLEMALKGMRKGLKYKIIPISWIGRTSGVSKMNVKKTMIRQFKMAMKIFFGIDN